MALTFNDAAGRFVNERGQFVSETIVRSVVDQIADQASARMAAASQAMLDGNMSLAAWQAEVQQTLKVAHVATATIAHGGAEQMTFSHYGSAGRAIRDQYDYLRQFAEQVANGQQPLNGTLTARASMYGQHARVLYETERARGQAERGYQSCRNVLHASESCAVCRGESAKGWVPVGSLIPIGSRTCLSRCRCTITYSREAAQAA